MPKVNEIMERQYQLEQFYYHEADLLDSRQYTQWLGLLAEDVLYLMPARVNTLVDNRQRGTEEMLSIDNELETDDGLGCPLREENLFHLALRAERAYKMNSWAENPPARTRRIIGNVRSSENEDGQLLVKSNFILHYSRPSSDDFTYCGERRDTLRPDGGTFKVARREVIMDYALIAVPTLGLIF